MAIILFGSNYKVADMSFLEKLAALSREDVWKDLRGKGFKHAALLATCNRFEIYAEVAEESEKMQLQELSRIAEHWTGSQVNGQCYGKENYDAVQHLFSVASGLDSLVVGESEILGQVKQAYEYAHDHQMTGKCLNVLWQRALYVGKQVRRETGVAMGHTSMASVAVELAQKIFGELSECRVLVVGAGQMAETAIRYFVSEKISKLYVINRTLEKAQCLAQPFKGEAVPWGQMQEALVKADVVLTSTGAEQTIIKRGMVEKAMEEREGKSLFFIDIAMPRDVDDDVHDLDNVYLYAMENLQAIVDDYMAQREQEMQAARTIVDQRAQEFLKWLDAAEHGRHADLKHGRR